MAATEGSVSQWISRLKAGDRAAAGPLWQRYFSRLVGLARRRLQGMPDRAVDAEDIALSAMNSFCRRAEQHQGASGLVADRDDLWSLLCDIAHNKVCDLWRRAASLKRGGLARATPGREQDSDDDLLARQLGKGPTPEEAVLLAEEVDHLLALLREDERRVALLKLDGHSNEEAHQMLGVGLATVERKLRAIRKKWGGLP